MKITQLVCTGLLGGIGGTALACDLPPLVAIPPKAEIGDRAPAIEAEVAIYFEAMTAYTACVQAALTAAGGDSAQPIVKAVLVQRNNYAVAEVQAVLKLFNANVPAPAAAEGERERSRRNRE
jgi:hypothetical protein